MADEGAKIKLSDIDFTGLEGELFDRLAQLFGRFALLNTLDLAAGFVSGVLPAANTPIIKGTQCVQSPVAAAATTQAHGLSRKPDAVIYWLECLTAELGYAIGDRYNIAPGTITVAWNATATYIVSNTAAFSVNRRDTGVSAAATAANWKVVAQPLLFPSAF